jgi:hypothetical protein
MKFADPQRLTCESCGREGTYPVASLLALEAQCGFCSNSFGARARRMNAQLKEWRTYTIAMCLAIAIEDFEPRLRFEDEDIPHISCLDNLVDLTEQRLAVLPNVSSPREAALELAQKAAVKVFPNQRIPERDILLADAFDGPPFPPAKPS